MINVCLSDLRRAILSKVFLVAAVSMAVIIILSSAESVLPILSNDVLLPSGFHASLLLNILSLDSVAFTVPILCVLPYSQAFIDDMMSGFIKQYLPRSGTRAYVAGKIIACGVSGGLVLFTGVMLSYLVATAAFKPLETSFGDGLGEGTYFLPVLQQAWLFFLSGAFWSITGLAMSSLTKSRYITYACPFVFYYILIILYERYVDAFYYSFPKEWLNPSHPWLWGRWGLSLLLIVLTALVSLLFASMAGKELSPGESLLSKKIKQFLPVCASAFRRWGKAASGKAVQVWQVAVYNFRGWHTSPRIILTFALAFILCFLLSNKAVRFAQEYGTTMQIMEAFVWAFGDGNSILLSSLLLVLLFSDMPFLGTGVPFYLMRIDRRTWLAGQTLYVILATGIYLLFILFSTVLLCVRDSFANNMWSDTAAIIGYSSAGRAVALPALVKTLEMSTPYQCMGAIFTLMSLYTLLMVFLMLALNIIKGRFWGVAGAFLFSLYGFLLNPQLIKTLFDLPDELMYQANVAVGWISPLNQATYNMHNFGYDLLPRLGQSCSIFVLLILLCFGLALMAIRKYNFSFTGTEG